MIKLDVNQIDKKWQNFWSKEKTIFKNTDKNKKHKDPWNAFSEEEFNNVKELFKQYRSIDFSFKYEWQGTGKWDE